MIDYECDSCGFVEERLVHRSDEATLAPPCLECKRPMRKCLGLPTGKEMARHIIEHEDDSTRPSARRGVTGPLIKIAPDRGPKGRIPGLGTDLGDGYYVSDGPSLPPWERGKK